MLKLHDTHQKKKTYKPSSPFKFLSWQDIPVPWSPNEPYTSGIRQQQRQQQELHEQQHQTMPATAVNIGALSCQMLVGWYSRRTCKQLSPLVLSSFWPDANRQWMECYRCFLLLVFLGCWFVKICALPGCLAILQCELKVISKGPKMTHATIDTTEVTLIWSKWSEKIKSMDFEGDRGQHLPFNVV